MLDKVGDQKLTIVCALPLYHIFALTICALMGAHFGAMNLLIPNPRDIPGLVRTLSKHRVNMFPAVNTLFNALANDPDFARSTSAVSSFRTVEAWLFSGRQPRSG